MSFTTEIWFWRGIHIWRKPRKWNRLQLQSLARRLILISYVNVLLVFLCIFFSLTVKTFPFLAFSYLSWSFLSQFIFVHFIFSFSTLPPNPHLPLSLPQMEESGSPRFRKLHFPVGLWINSPRKHFAKLGARWPSAASVKSVFWTFSYSLDQWLQKYSLKDMCQVLRNVFMLFSYGKNLIILNKSFSLMTLNQSCVKISTTLYFIN